MVDELERVIEELAETVAKIQREIDQSFKEFWTKNYRYFPDKFSVLEPLYDIEDRGDRIIVYVDAPGFSKNEIKIRVTEDAVEVIAEKSAEKVEEEKSRKYYVKQRLYSKLYKRIPLPCKVRPEHAKARFVDGVVIIEIPKSGAEKEVEINIE